MHSVISVDHVWKQYGLPSLFGGRRRPWALQDVSFTVEPGETLGFLGRNGAGKSTLLKVLAGVSPPTRGRVEVQGRVFPMIELNAGLHGELSGRENVYLLGAVMGLLRHEVSRRMPAIEAYCELGEWFDRPVRQYSSGMLARIGFAVAVNVDADVLLIDEVLAVGDLVFQQKCYSRLDELQRQGVTTLLVSHSLRQIERICDRVIYLDTGRVEMEGPSRDVCLAYSRRTERTAGRTNEGLSEHAHFESSGELNIVKAEMFNGQGERTSEFEAHDAFRVRLYYEAERKIVQPIVGCFVLTYDMVQLSGFSVGDTYAEPIQLEGAGWFEIRIPRLIYLPGRYTMDVGVRERNGRTIYSGHNLMAFSINPSARTQRSFGAVHTDVEWSFDCGVEMR